MELPPPIPPPVPPPIPVDVPPIIAEPPRQPWTPVAAGERVVTLDVLRGCALFGILTVNIVGFSWPEGLMTTTREMICATRLDAVFDWIGLFLAEGKFYPLFAFLFGLGASIQMERAEASPTGFAGRFCRRLAVLLGFGLTHALLIWDGDILVWYALCGFLLIPFRKRQPKTVLIWGIICLLLSAGLMLLPGIGLAWLSFIPEIATRIQNALAAQSDSTAELDRLVEIYARGSYGEIFATRLGTLIYAWLAGFFYMPGFFAMFLFGLYAGKRRLLHDVEAHVRLIRRVMIWGLVIGLPLNLIFALATSLSDRAGVYSYYLWFICHALLEIGGPAQSLAYAAGITLLLRRANWQRWLRPIATTGRMALTNYLSQSLICTTIFYSYGLGLFGTVGRAPGLALAVAIYAAQIVFSGWWLKRFQFGPMEWLWRTLTYWKSQPMRVRENN